MELRLRGNSYRAIAQQAGISESQAFRIVKKVLDRTAARADETAEILRTIQRERLEKLLTGIFKQALNGNLGAIDRAAKIIAELNKLDGLYVERQDTWNFNVDIASLTLDQVRQLAAGAHPATVFAQSDD